jgi:hypothetical protein
MFSISSAGSLYKIWSDGQRILNHPWLKALLLKDFAHAIIGEMSTAFNARSMIFFRPSKAGFSQPDR